MTKTDPLSGKLVTLFGGSGWLGTHVAQDLLERGARLKIASRHPEKARHLKPLACAATCRARTACARRSRDRMRW